MTENISSVWKDILEAPRDGRPIWGRGDKYGEPVMGQYFCWVFWDGSEWIEAGVRGRPVEFLTHYLEQP